MELKFENGRVEQVREDADFQEALSALNPATNPFAILSRSGNFYIQTLFTGTGYEIEKREGNAEAHFVAARTSSSDRPIEIGKWWQFWKWPGRRDEFTLSEVAEQFSFFASGRSGEVNVKWVRMEFNK